MTPLAQFRRAADLLSYARAGDDYQLTPAQKAREDRMRRESLATLRGLWRDHPDLHDAFREAIRAELVTEGEIVREAAA